MSVSRIFGFLLNAFEADLRVFPRARGIVHVVVVLSVGITVVVVVFVILHVVLARTRLVESSPGALTTRSPSPRSRRARARAGPRTELFGNSSIASRQPLSACRFGGGRLSRFERWSTRLPFRWVKLDGLLTLATTLLTNVSEFWQTREKIFGREKENRKRVMSMSYA